MNNLPQGVIPSQELRAMIGRGEIAADPIKSGPVLTEQVHPSIRDRRLCHRAWRGRASCRSGTSCRAGEAQNRKVSRVGMVGAQ